MSERNIWSINSRAADAKTRLFKCGRLVYYLIATKRLSLICKRKHNTSSGFQPNPNTSYEGIDLVERVT